jgi:predicted Zn-dependent peptidase
VPGRFQITELENGLRVVSERVPGVRSVALGFWVGVGSRNEDPRLGGVSHLIEHLIFKGTRSYSAFDIARTFDEMGGELNAATSKEYTLVHARFLDEHLDEAFAVMADMLARPLLADLESEREVVLEEVALYEDSPSELIHDYLAETVFYEHPLGRQIIGTSETLRGLDDPTIRTYYEQHYVPPSVVVAAAGHVDHEALCELARRHLNHVHDALPPDRELLPPKARHDAYFMEKETEQFHVCLGSPALTRHDPRRFALSVLDTALGGSSSSRLFQEIREKRGLVYTVYSYTSLYADTGLVAIAFGSRPEGLAEVMELCQAELEGLPASLTRDEVERTKEQLKGQVVLSMESPSMRMNRLGRGVLMDIEIKTLDGMIKQIDSVTFEQVVELATELYDVSTWSAVCIGPEAGPFRETVGSYEWSED